MVVDSFAEVSSLTPVNISADYREITAHEAELGCFQDGQDV